MADDLHIKLSIADQVFINAMAYLAIAVVLDQGRAQLALAKVGEVLPAVSRGHVFLEPVAEQADRMLAVRSIKNLAERRETYSSARTRAAMALGDLFFWRMALADEALSPAPSEVAG